VSATDVQSFCAQFDALNTSGGARRTRHAARDVRATRCARRGRMCGANVHGPRAHAPAVKSADARSVGRMGRRMWACVRRRCHQEARARKVRSDAAAVCGEPRALCAGGEAGGVGGVRPGGCGLGALCGAAHTARVDDPGQDEPVQAGHAQVDVGELATESDDRRGRRAQEHGAETVDEWEGEGEACVAERPEHILVRRPIGCGAVRGLCAWWRLHGVLCTRFQWPTIRSHCERPRAKDQQASRGEQPSVQPSEHSVRRLGCVMCVALPALSLTSPGIARESLDPLSWSDEVVRVCVLRMRHERCCIFTPP
jgi:hypothetical protein